MKKKLTLNINQNVIKRAKEYVWNKDVSASKLVENHLLALTKNSAGEPDNTQLVKSLSGVIDLPENFGYKKDYTEFLIKRYRLKGHQTK